MQVLVKLIYCRRRCGSCSRQLACDNVTRLPLLRAQAPRSQHRTWNEAPDARAKAGHRQNTMVTFLVVKNASYFHYFWTFFLPPCCWGVFVDLARLRIFFGLICADSPSPSLPLSLFHTHTHMHTHTLTHSCRRTTYALVNAVTAVFALTGQTARNGMEHSRLFFTSSSSCSNKYNDHFANDLGSGMLILHEVVVFRAY